MREAYPDEGGGQPTVIVKNTLVKTTNHKQARGLAIVVCKLHGLLLSMLQTAIYERVRKTEENFPPSERRSGRVEGKKARIDKEVLPAYKKFNGWET